MNVSEVGFIWGGDLLLPRLTSGHCRSTNLLLMSILRSCPRCVPSRLLRLPASRTSSAMDVLHCAGVATETCTPALHPSRHPPRPPRALPPAQDLTRDDFQLPVLGAKLRLIRDEVVVGKGFHVIR